jgi:photosystem I reaction center subunit VIII
MIGDYAGSFLPYIFVPLICMVGFATALGLFFVYVEQE